MNSDKNSKYNNDNKEFNQKELDKDKYKKEFIEKENSIITKENQYYLNEVNNKEKSIINIEDENLLISFSYISELNKNNLNEDNNNKNNLNIYNNYEFTPKNNNINNTYNDDIKKKNLNYIFNILNSDNKINSKNKNNRTQIFREINSSISCSNKQYYNNNFSLSSLKDISSIQYKTSNKKGNNFIIENTKNINIINSNEKCNKIQYEIINVSNIEIINKSKQNNQNLEKVSEMNYPKHLSNFSFGINNFNLITNNKKSNYENNHIIYDENKLNNRKENKDEYFSPKFNVSNRINEFNNKNNDILDINKMKKKQFIISHNNSNNINIINKGQSRQPEIIKYSNLQIVEGFPTFSIIDKKCNFKYKKIDVNRKKNSKEKNISYKKNKNKTNKGNILEKNIFPNEEELNINIASNKNNYRNIRLEKEKNKMKKNITFDRKNNSKKYIKNRIKNINIFDDNKDSNRTIDQNLKKKIQNILEKNFELILSNNLINNNYENRNSTKIKSSSRHTSNHSLNSNCSNSSLTKKKNINFKKGRNNKNIISSSCLYKGKHFFQKLDSKYIFSNSTFNNKYINNKSVKKNTNKNGLLNNTVTLLNNKNKVQKSDNKLLKNKRKNIDKKETNIIKFIKTNTRNGIKQEKTYIIDNRDINIFNIDINKNNNSLICYNIKQINNGNKNINLNNFDIQKSNIIKNNNMNKYKKQFEIISNFKNYKKVKNT